MRFLSDDARGVVDALERGRIEGLSARARQDDTVLREVVEALASHSSIARGWAAHVLGNLARDSPEKVVGALSALLKLAKETDDWVACWGLYALAELAAARPALLADHVSAIGKRLTDPVVMVATRVAEVVGNVGAAHPEKVAHLLPELREMLEYQDHVGTVAAGKWDIRGHKDVAEEAIRRIERALKERG